MADMDLNLLRVFDALLEEQSVTRAGQRLGVTQSAVSHALARLRHLFGDPLFERGPSGFQPTSRALEIAPRLRAGLAQLRGLLSPPDFDPATSDRRFTIAVVPYLSSWLIPELMSEARIAAPDVRFRIWNVGGDTIDRLDAGMIDLVLSPFEMISPRFAHTALFEEEMVWVLSTDHPLANEPLTLEALMAMPHLLIEPAEDMRGTGNEIVNAGSGVQRRMIWDLAGDLDGAFARARRVEATVYDATTALAIVARTEMIALVPRRLAERSAEHARLRLLEAPYRTDRITIAAIWRRHLDQDPGLQWLLKMLGEAIRKSEKPLRG